MKRQRIKYLNEEEKKKLLSALADRKSAARSYMMYDLMLNTGLRLSETISVNVGDIQDKRILNITGKGGRIRDIPLNKAIREHTHEFLSWKGAKGESLEINAALFLSRNHKRMSKRAVQRNFKKWIQLAGIEGDYSPHALRHTVGTELLNKSKNIRLVQEFLGHRDVSTTMVYTHVTKEQIAEAAEALSL
ncbi:MAG: tyrosine-type recombinase/integrase [Candidatus Omnitrophica bacterium]|nr:tyrosine-type recombinase/integrase [Candidatus Omnitrophota bacterium]MBU1134746.1 tyrosine-type recombinase/integrase [Candidatus Omnitrophota bacterium]MBU1366457.1 tyrosine-type recombinase/integrase [Candidatus Omnitrophota bacterium]MBU1524486.1 tyrosine-type recombinase/integrase [Candidatus Omnitrophota bacterium]MBU1811097.1 tyrosine-type recombinase/integrase [Candidatus Omnitrophota bacterium]